MTGRIGYTWGPALLYVKGGYAYADNNDSLSSPARRSRSPSIAAIRMARPSAPASNTCSPRTGRPRSNISITISAAPTFVTPAALARFGSFRNDEHTVKAGINYRFNWGGPVVAKY